MSILEDFYKRINSHLLYGVSNCSGSNCSPNACGACRVTLLSYFLEDLEKNYC